jgi:hypothetical protein
MLFRESAVFTRQIKELVDDDHYRQLQAVLMARPDAGDLIPGGGGLRKVRMPMAGRGKRGGARVIYYWMKGSSRIYMLLAYSKNAQARLSNEELALLRKLMREEFD